MLTIESLTIYLTIYKKYVSFFKKNPTDLYTQVGNMHLTTVYPVEQVGREEPSLKWESRQNTNRVHHKLEPFIIKPCRQLNVPLLSSALFTDKPKVPTQTTLFAHAQQDINLLILSQKDYYLLSKLFIVHLKKVSVFWLLIRYV